MNKIIVVKFGSELVTNNSGVKQLLIDQYAKGLVSTYLPSSLIVVTSGAVKAGQARAKKFVKSGNNLSEVTLSQLGASSIVSAWESAFAKVNVLAGGLLVTHHELQDTSEGPQFVVALQSALKLGVVSIVNENDALSDTELMKLTVGGDNDGLAAHIAKKVNAFKLVLFTAKGGVIDDENCLVDTIDPNNKVRIEDMLSKRTSSKHKNRTGRGGMVSKFQAACEASSSGIESIIAMPSTDMRGEQITKFVVG
ncbi:hypothetical protein H6800_02730 [Candidatus Nomurabacteria bacterium]|nr:hypothetical protein [Candidatus Nomurabacteria bacterium]